MEASKIVAALNALGLAMSVRFVPFSQSRNAKNKGPDGRPWQSLNWRITLTRNGRAMLPEFDYSAGIAHCPAYQKPGKTWNALDKKRAIEFEIERGKICTRARNSDSFMWPSAEVTPREILPNLDAVVWSQYLEANSVLDSGSFSDWCAEFGYSDDSISARDTWTQCVEAGLKFRAAFTCAEWHALGELFADY